jgi:phenylalanine ammonia-lyase
MQDRYSIRCLPQYLGAIKDGLNKIKEEIEIEINSATDNPLIDARNKLTFHSGNFLGQYIGIGMDNLRQYLGLIAKHLDTQIALLVSPEFNKHLPPSLAGNYGEGIQFGLKGLQICANSIMPLLLHSGNSITHLFPTHAEQYNQNINSQGFSSANLTWSAIEIMHYYLAISLIFSIQSVDLRTYEKYHHCNTRKHLSPKLVPLYEVIHQILGREISDTRPLILKNNEQSLDVYIENIVSDLRSLNSKIYMCIGNDLYINR